MIINTSNGMIAVGRIVIPMEFRRKIGIEVDDPVEMIAYKDGIFIRKETSEE